MTEQLEMKRIAPAMIKQQHSRIPWVTLILCLCLGSLTVLPLVFIVGPSALGIYGIDLENSSSFNESEFDDDFSVPPVVDITTSGLIFSRFRSIHLAFQSAFLSPDSPPPK
jgi:hypothetical protein